MSVRRYGTLGVTDGVEQFTGRYYHGRPLYRSTVFFGALPNAGTKQVAHGIVDLLEIETIQGAAENTLGTRIPIPN